MTWEDAATFLNGIRALLDVQALTADVHDIGVALARRYRLSVYDAMIVSAALVSGCHELLTEDMHDGLIVEDTLTIRKLFSG